ncbi:hypothetical protein T10_324 [Trichinella papuae]|uniref:Uncharacterized protein n=1 Tax=Trichinella papuae TaxID=268474 RepID=A0A0V1MGE1_9BILA|nr:hypothetical protein T10_324 [Trichinella papuae]
MGFVDINGTSSRSLRVDADFTSWGGNRSRAFGRICTNAEKYERNQLTEQHCQFTSKQLIAEFIKLNYIQQEDLNPV